MSIYDLTNPGLLALWMAHKVAKHHDNKKIHFIDDRFKQGSNATNTADKKYPHFHYKHLITRQTETKNSARARLNLNWLHRVFAQPHRAGTPASETYSELFNHWGSDALKLKPEGRIDMENLALVSELMDAQEVMTAGDWHREPVLKRNAHPIRDMLAELEVLARHEMINNRNLYECYRTPKFENQRGTSDSVSQALLVTTYGMTSHIDRLYDESNLPAHMHIRSQAPIAIGQMKYVSPASTGCFDDVNSSPQKLRPYQFIPDCVAPLCEFKGISKAELSRRTGINMPRVTHYATKPGELRLNLQELCALSKEFEIPLSLWVHELMKDCYSNSQVKLR